MKKKNQDNFNGRNDFYRSFILAFIFLVLFNFCEAQQGFVKVSNTHFVINNKPYYYVGTNFWYGAYLGAAAAYGNRPRLLRELDHLQKLGVTVKVCGPKTLIPKHIESLGVSVEHNLRKALDWCDVANMLRVQNERLDISYFPSTREYTMQYGLDKMLLDSLEKEIVIMHPGPINRGVEITSEVADCKQSVILNQVENGVAVRMAVMYLLASKI